jgi:hypothetical protein
MSSLWGLLLIPATYLFMSFLDTEETFLASEEPEFINYSIPVIGLSLCAIGFMLMTFFFVINPIFISANPLSILIILFFALLWASAYSFYGLAGTIPCLVFCWLLLHSQYSTDTRDFWHKLISPDPQSTAITVLGSSCMLPIFFGNRVIGMKSIQQSSLKYKFVLLTSSASIGICLGYVLYFANQIKEAMNV